MRCGYRRHPERSCNIKALIDLLIWPSMGRTIVDHGRDCFYVELSLARTCWPGSPAQASVFGCLLLSCQAASIIGLVASTFGCAERHWNGASICAARHQPGLPETESIFVFAEPGWKLSFAPMQPCSTHLTGKQSAKCCITGAWLAHIRATNHAHVCISIHIGWRRLKICTGGALRFGLGLVYLQSSNDI